MPFPPLKGTMDEYKKLKSMMEDGTINKNLKAKDIFNEFTEWEEFGAQNFASAYNAIKKAIKRKESAIGKGKSTKLLLHSVITFLKLFPYC